MKQTVLTLVAIASLAAASAQTLTITSGASSYQVFQRDASGSATISVSGTASQAAGRTIEARLVENGLSVPGFGWKSAGTVSGTAFKADIQKVPAGGPYRLELRVAGVAASASVENLLVGDIWILAGQSNMEGVGNLEDLPLPSAVVNSFDMTDTWVAAQEPLHRLVDAVDSFHWRRHPEKKNERLSGEALDRWIAARKKGAGVGLPFALEMVRRTGVPIGLLPCAHGGTSMDQWSPDLKDQGGASLYGGMIRRAKAVGGKVAGILWYQGESDANPAAAPLFKNKFTNLIAAARADLAAPNLPFLYVQIGRHVNPADAAPWNAVQYAQLEVESQDANTAMTTCLDCDMDDGIHVGTDSYLRLARRMAVLALGRAKRGPRPVSAVLSGASVFIKFDQINGHLTHKGRLSGFSIHDAEGKSVPLVYRARISPSSPDSVELMLGGKLPDGATVRYGAGRDPYVNLADSLDMPCPVFSLPVR